MNAILTDRTEQRRLVEINGRLYLTESIPMAKNMGKLLMTTELEKDIKQATVQSDSVEPDRSDLYIFHGSACYIGTVDKNGYVKLGMVLRYPDETNNNINVTYKWGSNAYDMLRFAENKIRETYGNSVAYIRLHDMHYNGGNFFIFTKDGKLTVHTVDFSDDEFKWLKTIRYAGNKSKLPETTQYVMINGGKAWVEKSDNEYFVTRIDDENKLISIPLRRMYGEMLFSNDIEKWDVEAGLDDHYSVIATNKGLFIPTDNQQEYYFVEWEVDSDILREGIKKIIGNLKSYKEGFYILTKMKNIYRVYLSNDGKLSVRTFVRGNVKDVLFSADKKLGLTEDGILFNLSGFLQLSNEEYKKDLHNKTIIGKNIEAILTADHVYLYESDHNDLKKAIIDLNTKIKRQYGIKEMPDLLETLPTNANNIYYDYIMGLKKDGRYTLFIKVETSFIGAEEGKWKQIDDIFPTKIIDGDDYATRRVLSQSSSDLLIDICK